MDLFAGYRYTVEPAEDPPEFESSHRELQVGVRSTSPAAPGTKLFFEMNIHSAKRELSFVGEDYSKSESGIGFGARIGLTFMASSKIGAGFAASLSTSNLAPDGEERGSFSDAWLSGDLFLNAWF